MIYYYYKRALGVVKIALVMESRAIIKIRGLGLGGVTGARYYTNE